MGHYHQVATVGKLLTLVTLLNVVNVKIKMCYYQSTSVKNLINLH